MLISGFPPSTQGPFYPGDYPGTLGPYGGRSMFGDIPPTPGSGSVTLPGSVESKFTLKAPIATKVVCFSRLLKCLRSVYDSVDQIRLLL